MAELEDYTIEVLEKEGKTIIPVTTTQAVMTSSGRYLEESIVEMEEVGEGEIVDISPEVEINPSIPSGAEVIACSSMRVGEKYYSMSSGGGETLYRHLINITQSSSNPFGETINCLFTIYSTKKIAYTLTSILSYLESYEPIAANGTIYASSSNMIIYSIVKTYEQNGITINTNAGSRPRSISYLTMTDIRFTMDGEKL